MLRTALTFWFAILVSTASATQKVELELVLAIDTSTSVNKQEYALQRDGLAAAFRDTKVVAAIEGLGANGMAVAIVQWSGAQNQVLAMRWTHLNDLKSTLDFAARIQKMQRQTSGFTDIASAIDFSVRELEQNGFEGERFAVDVSGDGTSDRNDPAIARDRAISKGITINGLVIHSVEYDLGDLARFSLEKHYRERVIGGPGAFLMQADSFNDFAQAMRQKLYREISGPLLASK